MTPVFLFLGLSFGISLIAFAVIARWPAAHSPDTAAGLPVWLVMVWGPSLAALMVTALQDDMTGVQRLLGRMVQIETVPLAAWGLILAPLVLLAALCHRATGARRSLGLGPGLMMVGINLIMGPLGEELGWRGILQDHWHASLGWFAASLAVGAVWLIWHLPLWLIDSPQAHIPLWLFGGHCLCYAVIIGAAHTMSGGSLVPAIAIHLSVNLAANLAVFAGFEKPASWFRASLPGYGFLAVLAVGLTTWRSLALAATG